MATDRHKITAAVVYVAGSIPQPGSDLREEADARVKQIIGEKVAALVTVDHQLSPALPRDPCHYKPHREYVALAEIFVFTRSELAELMQEAKVK